MSDDNLLIVGAGCAGLSLAVHLLRRGTGGRRMVLVDPRTEFPRDRTWCFWKTDDHPFDHCVSHRWHRWRVEAAGEVATGRSERHPYQQIPSDGFYRAALDELRGDPRVELRLGEPVTRIEEDAAGVTAHTPGAALRGGWAFDSRPRPDRKAPEGGLLQHFAGAFLRFQRPVVDPETVTLMDFLPPAEAGPGAVAFVYVLPYSRHEALVEATWISSARLPDEVYQRHIRLYAARTWDSPYEVVHREDGAIPMAVPEPPPAASRVIPIGLRGGGARPSSGYAFLGIQRTARHLAEQIATGSPPRWRAPWRRRSALLDRVFLSYLRRHPERAPALFLQMFRRVDGDRLARFLSDRGTLLDDLAVIWNMPRLPMTREALHLSLRAWGRA